MIRKRNIAISISTIALVLLLARLFSYSFVLVDAGHFWKHTWTLLYLSVDAIAIVAISLNLWALKRMK